MIYKYLDNHSYYINVSPCYYHCIHFHHIELQQILIVFYLGYLLHSFWNNFAKVSMEPIGNQLRKEKEIRDSFEPAKNFL